LPNSDQPTKPSLEAKNGYENRVTAVLEQGVVWMGCPKVRDPFSAFLGMILESSLSVPN